MRDSPIRVEIVAPVHNRQAITLQCLRSLSRISREGLDVHTIIVDDGSTDGTGDAIRKEFPEVEVIDADGDLWYTEGTNVGIRAALEHDPQFILAINDDAVFDSEFLGFMIETATKHPRVVVGSLLLLWDTPHKLFQTAPVWDTWWGGWRHWSSQTVWTVPSKSWKVDIIVGNCVLIPVAALRECGLMDSRRYPNFGDAEFTPRLKKHGWNLLIDPRARVFCQPNAPSPSIRQMSLKKMVSELIFNLRSGPNLRRLFYSCMDTAPSRFQGFLAFAAYMFWGVVGNRPVARRWRQPPGEEPLSRTFASSVINDE